MKFRILGIVFIVLTALNLTTIHPIQAQDEEECFEILDAYMMDYLQIDNEDEFFDFLDSLDDDEIDDLLEESGGGELLDACENDELNDFNPPVNNDENDPVNIHEFTGILEIQVNPNSSHRAFGVFSKYVNVFGVSIYATEDVPNAKVLHAANIMAEYLDNDEDGEADNLLVVEALVASNASLIMFNRDGSNAEDRFVDNMNEADADGIQPLYGFEVHPDGSDSDEFDATLEEVLHLITHVGYAAVYPDIFGEEAGSEIANAMDTARGGYFNDIPARYPAEAWYTYDDETCEYDCQITEYFYWSLTTLLGAQDYAGRAEQIENEWQLTTPAELEAGDPVIYAILTNPEYHLPTVLPDGQYAPKQAE